MELDLLITELDETTIQIDKMRYLTTQISTKACEKTKYAKNALQYDFESQEIVKCAAILSDYIEAADVINLFSGDMLLINGFRNRANKKC